MAITKTSGDGFALYNGVKLPNINEVWEEVKDTYPYASLTVMDAGTLISGYDGHYLASFVLHNIPTPYIDHKGKMCFSGGNIIADTIFLYCTDSKELFDLLTSFDGNEAITETLFIDGTRSGSTTESLYGDERLVWSSCNFLNDDGSVYLSASDPISLDGMTVVEWDGDTEGLERPQYLSIYRLEDYISKPTRCAVVADDNGSLRTDFIVSTATGSFANSYTWLVLDMSTAVPAIYAMEEADLGVSPGVYMMDSIRLFAYDLNASNIHDDTWPIEWRTTEVTGNTQCSFYDNPFVKVSNLTPTPEALRSTTVTVQMGGISSALEYTDEIPGDGYVGYFYSNPEMGEVPMVVSDGSVYEAGIYCMNIGILGDEYDWVITLTKPDSDEETDLMPVYKRVNGTWVKQTAYQRQNGEWVLLSTAE